MAVDAARPDLTHQVHPHCVTTQSEERRMPEAENAAIAPDEIDGNRQRRVAEILSDKRHGIGREMQRRRCRNREVQDRHDNRNCCDDCEKHIPAARDHWLSAARPVCGNSPRGRRWMNRMSATSTKILPRTAPE